MQNLSFLIMLFFVLTVSGQESKEDIVISSGNTIINPSGSVDWIIGENLMDHFTDPGTREPQPENAGPENSFFVYPTKAVNWLIIDKKTPDLRPYHVECIDVSGKSKLLEENLILSTRLDISSLECGFYLIKIRHTSKDQPLLFRIVKMRE